MAAHDTIVTLKDITFGYHTRPDVLKKISFTLSEGDRVGLVGPNGSGKTTLFHIIMGLLKPLAGEINILGEIRKIEPAFREVREKIGLLFQDSDDQLFSPTVAEDIAFGPLNLGKSPKEAKAIVKETLAKLGMSGFEQRVTYNLSGGEKRLVAFATVLAMNPKVLLLDEPTAGLDSDVTKKITAILKNHFHTYIITSHDEQLLKETTNCTYRMTKGAIERIN
ncbi:MAG: ABC transporter ATP-binding protein [Deltaproteobacteria bacterium]|nr:ABC transporter ATP-binding protein [Deltaproteobacteria bacterium]